MQVKVQALRQGYSGHRRVREGSIFFMNADRDFILKNKIKNEEKLKELEVEKRIYKSGKTEYILPSWVKLVQPKAESKKEELESVAESPKLIDEEVI